MTCGCADTTSLYPLKVGEQWTYTVNNSFTTRVQQVRVTRRVPTGSSEGYELNGPMGISRLVWRGGVLFAGELPNVRIPKPMPLLMAKDQPASMSWSGQIESMGRAQQADATLSQAPESIDQGAKKLDSIRADLLLKFDKKSVELTTWYVKGIGPVKQDQRTNGKLDYHVDLQSGP